MRSCLLGKAESGLLLEISRNNLCVLGQMIDYVAKQRLGLFRISSDCIPLASHPQIQFPWQSELRQELSQLGRQITRESIRVSMHPGQYTVLNSPNSEVVERAVADLVYHATFLDALEQPLSSKIVLHVGGVYGDKRAAMDRFCKNFSRLPEFVQKRLVLENDEISYSIDEVVALCRQLGIPAVMDVFHHALLPAPEGSCESWLETCASTWQASDGRQKIHYSQQMDGGKRGAHSQTIMVKPFMNFVQSLGLAELDIMLEVKDKNISACKCRDCLDPKVSPAVLEQAWSHYKYAVMERSQQHYQALRKLFGQGPVAAQTMYELVDEAMNIPVTKAAVCNAAEHVWGYVAQEATPAERKKFFAMFQNLDERLLERQAMKKMILRMAHKQKREYLLNSLYFYLE